MTLAPPPSPVHNPDEGLKKHHTTHEKTYHGDDKNAARILLVELILARRLVGLVNVVGQSQAAINMPLTLISSPRQSLYPFLTAGGCEAIY